MTTQDDEHYRQFQRGSRGSTRIAQKKSLDNETDYAPSFEGLHADSDYNNNFHVSSKGIPASVATASGPALKSTQRNSETGKRAASPRAEPETAGMKRAMSSSISTDTTRRRNKRAKTPQPPNYSPEEPSTPVNKPSGTDFESVIHNNTKTDSRSSSPLSSAPSSPIPPPRIQTPQPTYEDGEASKGTQIEERTVTTGEDSVHHSDNALATPLRTQISNGLATPITQEHASHVDVDEQHADQAVQVPSPPTSVDLNVRVHGTESSPLEQLAPRKSKAPVKFGEFVSPENVPETVDPALRLESEVVEDEDDYNEHAGSAKKNTRSLSRANKTAAQRAPGKTPAKGKKSITASKANPSANSKVTKSRKEPAKTAVQRKRRITVTSNEENGQGPSTEERQSMRKFTVSAGGIMLVLETDAPVPKKRATKTSTPKGGKAATKRSTSKGTKEVTKSKAKPKKSLVVTLQPLPAINPQNLELSKRMTTREPLDSKPEPKGKPPVWADSRQALCETLPYFKKPQGGCYSNDGHVYGFLFDGVGHCREYMDENVIICRAGGSMTDDGNRGMVQGKDQLMKDSQVQSILNDIEHKNPLIVICGSKNVAAPCKMPYQYNVLGWFKPISVWSEKTTGKGEKTWKTVKYRLERLRDVEPWHAPKDSEIPNLSSNAGSLTRATCIGCRQEYPQVYLQSWMCLNQDCHRFWKIGSMDAPTGSEGLNYNPDFLLHKAPAWGDESKPPADLRPPVPDVGKMLGDNISYINTRGVCCPNCGRCNPRRLFRGWVCEAPGCTFKLFPEHRSLLPPTLYTPWDNAPTLVRNRVDRSAKIKLETFYTHGYKVSKYSFEGIQGCFIHAAASKEINAEPGVGADAMFADIQTKDLGLERRTFGTRKMSGGKGDAKENPKPDQIEQAVSEVDVEPSQSQEPSQRAEDEPERKFEEGDLMTAFSMNYGMPYKFVASGASKPFEDAPKCVNDTRARLNWAAREFLQKPEEDRDFNEELIFAYMEGQKIEYHDDGESGLGPRIATLSLGGRAEMRQRMKQKHFIGCSKTGILTEEEPKLGSIGGDEMLQKRLEKHRELQQIKDDPAEYNKRRKEIPKELGLFEKRMKKADDLVTVTLSHGDIILMDGYDIQKYLEHKVVAEGHLRFALTCRTVLDNHLKEEELPNYEVREDEIRYEGPQL